MKFGFISLGCSKNLVDSEKIISLLKYNKQEIVSDPILADVIIINTCGFITSAKEESINTILEFINYHKKIIVCGCLAQRYKEEILKEIPEIDCLITIKEYSNLSKILSKFLNIHFNNDYDNVKRLISTKKHLGYLKIAEGCLHRCSFCAIPLIRGRYKSIDIDTLLIEAKQLLDQGVLELVLIAQDTTGYGIDIYQKYSLDKLLIELNKLPFIWIRILYMYPDSITKELIDTINSLDKVIPYFDIPIQYGNDYILKLMNRKGNTKDIKDTINYIRTNIDNSIIRTTLIVGFPNENDDTFNDTLEYIKDIRFDHLGAFKYSKEEDTKAYKMIDNISEELKEERYHQLMVVQRDIINSDRLKLLNTIQLVVVESYEGLRKRYSARSAYFAPDGIDGYVYIKSDMKLDISKFYYVKVIDIIGYDIMSEYYGDY